MKRQLGEKGQIVIPKDAREHFALKKGASIDIEITAEGILLRPITKEEKLKKLEQFFVHARTKGKDITLAELKQIEDESYDLP